MAEGLDTSSTRKQRLSLHICMAVMAFFVAGSKLCPATVSALLPQVRLCCRGAVLRITLLAAGFVIGDTLHPLTLSFHTWYTSLVHVSYVQCSVYLYHVLCACDTKSLLDPEAQIT